MKEHDCRSELVLLERRGRLSFSEQGALDAHLSVCDSCRLSFQLGRDFDSGTTLEAGDGLRISRLGERARLWADSAAPVAASICPARTRKVRVLLWAACISLVAAGASATAEFWGSGTDSTVVLPAKAPLVVVPTPPPLRPAAPLAEEKLDPQLERPAVPLSNIKARPVSESAKTLFQKASTARRAGDTRAAIALYGRLQSEFPSSPEAALGALRLGSLLLERGDASAALRQFDRHLAGSGRRLRPEGLYGRGRALAALRRAPEERKTWHRLLEEFPDSPYAAHARRRVFGEGASEVRSTK